MGSIAQVILPLIHSFLRVHPSLRSEGASGLVQDLDDQSVDIVVFIPFKCVCEHQEVPPPTEHQLEGFEIGVNVGKYVLLEVLGMQEQFGLVACNGFHVTPEEAVVDAADLLNFIPDLCRDGVELAFKFLAPSAAWPPTRDAEEKQDPEERLHVVNRVVDHS